MNVLGFQEACDTAEWVRIRNEPVLNIPVVTPVGMMLLKLIAWTDRPNNLRKKDAADIRYLLKTYELIKDIRESLYDDRHIRILEQYEYDITRASCHLMGIDVKAIAQKNTCEEITKLSNQKTGILNRLAEEMGERSAEFDMNRQLLGVFMAGFNE